MSVDVIVVGAGIIGLSTAAELARRGQRVALFDQFEIPNALASSHGETRVIRTAYFEHPSYVYLAQRSWVLFEVLGKKTGDRLIQRTGGIYVGPPDGDLIRGSVEAAEAHGLEYRLGSNVNLDEYEGKIVIPDGSTLFWDRNCGILFADRSLASLVKWCHGAGVELHPHESATSWSANSASVTVNTSRASYSASSLVICAGAWARKLLSDVGLPLRVTRQVVGFCAPPAGTYSAPTFPITCFEGANGDFFYTIPACQSRGAREGWFKIGDHNPIGEVSADDVDRAASSDDIARLTAGLECYLPGAGTIVDADVCLYTMTPDGHFIIDKHPQHPNVVYAAGGSGHAFKFGPVIGESLADLATRGSTDLPVGFLSASRFTTA